MTHKSCLWWYASLVEPSLVIFAELTICLRHKSQVHSLRTKLTLVDAPHKAVGKAWIVNGTEGQTSCYWYPWKLTRGEIATLTMDHIFSLPCSGQRCTKTTDIPVTLFSFTFWWNEVCIDSLISYLNLGKQFILVARSLTRKLTIKSFGWDGPYKRRCGPQFGGAGLHCCFRKFSEKKNWVSYCWM